MARVKSDDGVTDSIVAMVRLVMVVLVHKEVAGVKSSDRLIVKVTKRRIDPSP